jgi:putative transposase
VSLNTWVEVVYHRRVHSETGFAPLERFHAGGPPALPSPALLREAFLWSEQRMVTKAATVSLHGNHYEVDAALVGRRVELVFDPFDLTQIEVRYRQRPMGLAVAVRIGRHTHPKAQREPAPPPAASGINYLQLIADQREQELTGPGIDYSTLTDTDTDTDEERTDEH